MHRRSDFTRAAYLARYGEIYSRFGIETRGIAGYSQFHIDPDASRRAVTGTGLGASEASSVSELHLPSLEEFFAATEWNRALGAQEDEDLFVDRAVSVMWRSDVASRR